MTLPYQVADIWEICHSALLNVKEGVSSNKQYHYYLQTITERTTLRENKYSYVIAIVNIFKGTFTHVGLYLIFCYIIMVNEN